jgi:hypothetical protein
MFATRRRTAADKNDKTQLIRAAVETLESRQLLSAALLSDLQNIVVTPAKHSTSSGAAVNTSIEGYTPAQIRKAYGFDQITLPNGIQADGAGQTIAIVTAYNDPNLASDLKSFDAAMGIDDPLSLSVVSQTGGKVKSIATDAGWAGETALDVEWAHAIAPAANILVVEATSPTLANLLSAVDYARNAAGVSVVSMSWGADEFWSETSFDHYFTTPSGHQGVTFVAASGDEGSWWGPTWPSSSSSVLAVGGTTLNLDASATATGNETAWRDSGGGFSSFENAPSYQSNVQRSGVRSAPDVSYDANPYTGFAFYNSVDDGSGYVGWQVVGGTSAGAPQWAAWVAIANQGRAAAGKASLDGATGTLPTLYSLYNDPTAYANAFNDVTWGRSSYFNSSRVGYDAVTGLGTPKAPGVVDALIGKLTASNTATTTPTTVASRRARAQLVHRATPAVTPAPDLTIAPAAVVPLAVQPVIKSTLLETQTTATSRTLIDESRGSSSYATSTGAGSGHVFSSHRVQATFLAGYEPAPRPTATLALWSAIPTTPSLDGASSSTERSSPWEFLDLSPIIPALPPASGDTSATPDVLPIPAPAAVSTVYSLSTPRMLMLAGAAIVFEAVILTCRRARRKTAVESTHHPIIEPLRHDDC